MASYTISPIWGAGAQLFDNSGNVLSGGKIYTYYAGSTTPLATYTTPTGSTANSNPIVANSAGRLTNEIWFPVIGAYKFVLKDANDVLLATYDNIPTTPQPPIVNDASSISYQQGYEVDAGNFTIGATYLITSVGTTDFVAIGAAANITGILFTATGVGSGTGKAAYSRTVENRLRDYVSVLDFNADNTGVVDSTSAFTDAIDYLVSTGGGTLYVPEGSYLLNGVAGTDTIKNGVLIPFNSSGGSEQGNNNTIKIIGASENTKLLAGSDNMYIVRLSGSHCQVSNLRLDANGHTGVTGLGLVPQNLASTTAFADQSQNTVDKLVIKGCTEAIVLQCGPGSGGATSACYYNHFQDIHIIGNGNGTRGVYFKTGIATAPYSNSNRNHFYDIRFNSVNTGLQIESGGTNNFYGLSFESIASGTTPSAIPTGIVVNNLDGNGLANEANRIFGATIESVTRHIENANNQTELYGVLFDGSKILFTTNPSVIVGGYDPSVTPQKLPGYVYQQNAYLTGYRSGAIQFTNGAAFGASPQSVLNYYQKGTWTPTYKATTTNPTVTYGVQIGLYERIGNLCFINLDIYTDAVASAGSGILEIGDLPFTAAVNGGYNQCFGVGLVGGFTTAEPRGAMVVSNSTRIRLTVPSAADYQTSGLSNVATVANLTNAAGANRVNLTFCYQVA